jgi:hypothetical protein
MSVLQNLPRTWALLAEPTPATLEQLTQAVLTDLVPGAQQANLRQSLLRLQSPAEPPI